MQVFATYWREILSFISVLIAIGAYISYIKGILSRQIQAHIFSWAIWTLTTGIAFFAQMAGGASWGWAQLGVTALVCIGITILAIRFGDTKIDTVDWYSFFLAIMAIILWKMTANPFYASLFATLADLIWYIPTFRKVWHKPRSEPLWYYGIMNIKHWLSLAALSTYSWTTMLFSSSIIVTNIFLMAIMYIRRRKQA